MVLHLCYFVQLIPMSAEDGLHTVMDLPLIETRVIDFKFLPHCARPTICFIYEDGHRTKHVKTMVIDLNNRELVPGPWSHSNVDFSASLLIPIANPLGGVVVIASNSITYLGNLPTRAGRNSSESGTPSIVTSVEIPTAMCCAYAPLTPESNRILFADHKGRLQALVLCTGADGEVCG